MNKLDTFISDDVKLNEDWRQSYGPNYENFIYDGAIDPSLWLASKTRILCILKEAHGNGHWNYAETTRNNGGLLRVKRPASQATQNRMVEWVYALDGSLSQEGADVEEDRRNGYKAAKSVMLRSALINIKKADGVSRSSAKNLHAVANRDAVFIKRQIKLLSPTIILCCGTFPFIARSILPDHSAIRGTQFSFQSEGLPIIAVRHPGFASLQSYKPLAEEVMRIKSSGFLLNG